MLISVSLGDGQYRASNSAVLRPDTTIKFIYSRSQFAPESGYLIFKGTHDRSIDASRRFSLSGVRSLIPGSSPRWRIYVYEYVHDLAQNDSWLDRLDFGPVYFDEGEFSIVGDLDEPTIFTIETSRTGEFFFSLQYAILEPGVNYRVVPLGEKGEVAIQADRDSLHTKLITSWQFEPEYITLLDNQKDAFAELREERAKLQAEHVTKFIQDYQVAEPCTHLELSDDLMSSFAPPYRSRPILLGEKMVRKRSAALRKIIRETSDPELAAMAFKLAAVLFPDDALRGVDVREERSATLNEFAATDHTGLVADEIKQSMAYRSNYELVEKKQQNCATRADCAAVQITHDWWRGSIS